MPRISSELRFVLGVIAGLGGMVFGLMLYLLEKHITRFIRRILSGGRHLGRAPVPRPAVYWVILAVSGVMSVFGAAVASSAPVLETNKQMTGTFRIAIASFRQADGVGSKDLGKQLAEAVRSRLEKDIEKVSPDLDITVWGPMDLEPVNGDLINGSSENDRNLQAENLANQIDASMVVYGSLEQDQGQAVLTPQFFIKAENFYEAQEITGPHVLGEPILLKQSEIGGRIQVGSQMFSRCTALTNIVIGLAHYLDQDYDLAVKAYQQADDAAEWTDPRGKKVLYLLMGNATIRKYSQLVQQKQPSLPALLDDAERYYYQSVQLDDQYARAYIGLGSIYYLKSLLPFQASMKPADIDGQLLAESKTYYRKALAAVDQSPLADIPTKAHFGFGQVNLMEAYSGRLPTLNSAIVEFQAVIGAYGDGENPRIRDLAAEAHARMGLALDLSGKPGEASKEYQQASDLLSGSPDRQKQYQNRARLLSAVTPTP